MQDSPTLPSVLRVLDGPLQGCEFALERPRTLFIVGPQSSIADEGQPFSVPEDAIYLPGDEVANFEVLLTDNSRDGCVVRLLGGSEEHWLEWQMPHVVGGLRIALRPPGEPWAAHLLNPVAPPAGALAWGNRPETKRWWLPLLCASVLVAGLAATWYTLRDTSVSSVEKLLGGAVGPVRVVHGREQGVYVFADNERDLNWARQVMTRNGHSAERVLTPAMERSRLQLLLAERMPQVAWHRIDFSDLQHPQIWVSSQRNNLNATFRGNLEKLLRDATPYTTSFTVQAADDPALARRAELALARLALPFERTDRADSVTFSIQGSLQDTELAAVRDLVNGFYRQWGDRYVHFAVELKDDWLKGKSFQYGPSGYIKMTPSSWYFPKPI